MDEIAERKEDLEEELEPRMRQFVLCLFAGMTIRMAAKQAGFKGSKEQLKFMLSQNANAVEYLKLLRTEASKQASISLEVVTKGFKDAIEQARNNEDANSQINGWREIAKLYGLYAPETKQIELTGSQAQIQRTLTAMSESDLLELAGKEQAIEGEFELIPFEPKKAGHG